MKYVAIVFIMQLLSIGAASANDNGTKKIWQSVEVLETLTDKDLNAIPITVLQNSAAIAILPEVVKIGWFVGGRHGAGVMFLKKGGAGTTAPVRWSSPIFIKLTGGSVGWQIGAQSSDIVLAFSNSKSVDGILKGKFALGADASIAAGPVGGGTELATDIQLRSEIYSWSKSRGLFAGVALDGTIITIDHDSNHDYYGSEIKPRDILSNDDNRLSGGVLRIHKLLRARE